MEVPKDFKRHIRDDTRNCILMVGAGLSHAMIREGGRRLPDWRRLTELMICELGKRVPEATRNKLGDLLEQSKYLAVAQEFKRSTRPDVFAQFLREQLDPPDFMQSRIHETILAIQFHGIITTNFDRVIEFHTDRFRPLVYPHFLDEPAAFQGGGFLAKIHGCIRMPNLADNLVLTTDSYIKLRNNEKYQSLIRDWFLNYTILTVGFSLTDPDFLGVIKDLQRVFEDGVPTLYALVRQPTVEQQKKWRNKCVEVIPYHEHQNLRSFFSELLKLSEAKYPSMTLKTHPLVFIRVKDIKAQAWAFYAKWKSEGSYSKVFGKVSVTVKGWRHMTRGSRPQLEVCHKLTLLPCAKEIVENAAKSVLIRVFDPTTDHLGRAIQRELHILRGCHIQSFRADMRVEVVLDVTRLVERGEPIAVRFYSVYEKR